MNIRKIFIVDKEFQYPFILKNLALLLFTFVLIYIALEFWQYYQTAQGFLIRPPTNSQVVEWAKANNVAVDSAEFARQFLVQAKVYTFFELLWKPLLVVFIINIVVLFLANLYFSNRIAGPIHRLKKVLIKRKNGETVYPLCFRKGDPFHDMAELLNENIFTKKEIEDYKKKSGDTNCVE